MDKINIETGFTTAIVSELIKKLLKDEGYNLDIQLNKINATITDEDTNGKPQVHLDVDAEIDKEAIWKLIKAKLLHKGE